jgi:hypothetical protein
VLRTFRLLRVLKLLNFSSSLRALMKVSERYLSHYHYHHSSPSPSLSLSPSITITVITIITIIIVQVVLMSLSDIGNFVLVFMLVIFIFAILGRQIFQVSTLPQLYPKMR